MSGLFNLMCFYRKMYFIYNNTVFILRKRDSKISFYNKNK